MLNYRGILEKQLWGTPISDFYIDITPFLGFFSRQSESLAEEVAS